MEVIRESRKTDSTDLALMVDSTSKLEREEYDETKIANALEREINLEPKIANEVAKSVTEKLASS